ncbi:hypothetical protein L0Y98_27080 [Burkholderia multivorans]|uniref:hypothetical protein n=1 Tax=Burkholderia multivorans TaxID=87883 RepID=UPI002018ED2A|nr:hypothetical protein [Burkholderia multivorans]UQP22463.1 hypothetical protein L0Y98_27080 [Burkholderia multivorans]
MDKPEIDWKRAPKRARWWAVDANGQARWYCSPDIKPFTDFWGVDEVAAPTFEFTGDWRTSLTERPR